ncbi:MAG: ankyrin repeat domain-containing protein [Pirellulaceae bacterium]|nr:ankyrin repeat domain-containing protein [Planctomycetales bacterium]
MSHNAPSDYGLPTPPSWRHLQLQAKTLLRSARAGNADALERLQPFRKDQSRRPKLAEAQLAIARECGFSSWTELKIFVENASRTFNEKLNVFLSEGWAWGDARRGRSVLGDEPLLATANIFAAATALDVAATREILEMDPRQATVLGGPKKWPAILYATWSCLLAERQDAACEVVQLLIDHGADPNASWRNPSGVVDESALYGCVNANCDRVARVLLDAGADPNDGESLYHACENWNLAMLEALGDHQLKPEDVSYCIKHAIDYRWEDGIRWFLQHGADPNATYPTSGETSLHWAIKRNCPLSVIIALLDAGADPDAQTFRGCSAFLGIKGRTPYDFAMRLGRQDVAQLLIDRGATATAFETLDRFVIACANGDRMEAEGLLAANPELSGRVDANDRRLIANVAQMRQWEGVRLMVHLGWLPDQSGGWMNATPLTWAMCFGDAEAVDFLLTHGASPTKDVGGYFGTPIHTAIHCRWGDGNHVAAVKRLLQEPLTLPSSLCDSGDTEIDRALSDAASRSADDTQSG